MHLRYNIEVIVTENIEAYDGYTEQKWQVIDQERADDLVIFIYLHPDRNPNFLVKGQKGKILIYNCCSPDRLSCVISWKQPWSQSNYEAHYVPCKYLTDLEGNPVVMVEYKKDRIDRIIDEQ